VTQKKRSSPKLEQLLKQLIDSFYFSHFASRINVVRDY